MTAVEKPGPSSTMSTFLHHESFAQFNITCILTILAYILDPPCTPDTPHHHYCHCHYRNNNTRTISFKKPAKYKEDKTTGSTALTIAILREKAFPQKKSAGRKEKVCKSRSIWKRKLLDSSFSWKTWLTARREKWGWGDAKGFQYKNGLYCSNCKENN